jgi:hypothetical protein
VGPPGARAGELLPLAAGLQDAVDHVEVADQEVEVVGDLGDSAHDHSLAPIPDSEWQ